MLRDLISPHIESFNFMLEEGLSLAAQVRSSLSQTVLLNCHIFCISSQWSFLHWLNVDHFQSLVNVGYTSSRILAYRWTERHNILYSKLFEILKTCCSGIHGWILIND